MDQEIEVKFLLSDYAALMEKVSALQLPCTQVRVHEFNLRYDLPDGSLLAKKQVLRLRQDVQAHITFKGPGMVEDDVLLRKEIEVVVSDFDTTDRLLKALGYEVVMIYEKFRANYLVGDVTLSVDETPLGLFIELEGQNPAQLRQAAARLALSWSERINLSYSALLWRYNRSSNHSFRDLSFANFQDLQVTPQQLGISYADLSD